MRTNIRTPLEVGFQDGKCGGLIRVTRHGRTNNSVVLVQQLPLIGEVACLRGGDRVRVSGDSREIRENQTQAVRRRHRSVYRSSKGTDSIVKRTDAKRHSRSNWYARRRVLAIIRGETQTVAATSANVGRHIERRLVRRDTIDEPCGVVAFARSVGSVEEEVTDNNWRRRGGIRLHEEVFVIAHAEADRRLGNRYVHTGF